MLRQNHKIVIEAILLKMTIINGHYKEGSKEKQQDSKCERQK